MELLCELECPNSHSGEQKQQEELGGKVGYGSAGMEFLDDGGLKFVRLGFDVSSVEGGNEVSPRVFSSSSCYSVLRLMMNRSDSKKNKKAESLDLQESEMPGSSNLQNQSPDQMIEVPTELDGENSDIIWSGGASICCKKLKHYPAFNRSGSTIPVYSFVFVLAGDDSHNIGYLEDLYEDYRSRKMVKVRWFHRTEEVSGLISEPRPNEVVITPHVQVVSAECIDGLATILTPKHYEHCLAVLSEDFSDGIYMCSRQIKKNRITPFPLSKLRGYSNQTIFCILDLPIDPNKLKQQISSREEKEEAVACQEKTQPTEPKSEIKLPSKGLAGTSEPHDEVPSFSVGEEIEVLSNDSGLRGCWFRCKILQVSGKVLKVLHMDVEDVEGPGNLEEWVLAHRFAVPDKLGMRWLGRQTIRPFPPKNSSNASFSIGAPVDAWWCDGWWEGVVVGTNIRGKNPFHVYFPGENIFQNFEEGKLRTSKDWVDNRWAEVNPKPDVLNFIPSNVKSNMKLQRCLTLGGSSGFGSGLSPVGNKVVASSEPEAAEKEGQELPVLKKMKGVALKKKNKAYV
ncbi:hypothetical protein L6452_35211 [Arctium lappa]|uniref:Uncharacterized protein n=1 Tax=Arctium lappa TaxID=4217 RepID=A0ACB8Y6H3_ARCLA|nr:hypothetical protein L6452_35211 [Arctium lappa]